MLWLVTLLIITGALNTILLKLQNCQETDSKLPFYHPLCQLTAMFLGEALALVPYFLLKRTAPELGRGAILKPSPRAYAILTPALLDLVASLLSYVALTLLPSSIWQILKGGVILTTLLANRLLYRIKPSSNGLLGCALAFLGILTVGLAEFLQATTDDTDPLKVLAGLVLVLASLAFTGIQFAYEQQLFRKFNISALQLVGFEGLYGLAGSGLLLVVVGCLGCPLPEQHCVAYKNSLHLDSLFAYFSDLAQNGWLTFFCVL
jgi:drug/metabolite transporter (DMT)-like permease